MAPPLYQQLTDHLRTKIFDVMVPGDTLPTEADLAREHNVSLITVRQSLTCLDREGLLCRRPGSKTLVQDPSLHKPVGILVEQDISIPDVASFYIRLAMAVRATLETEGHSTRFYFGSIKLGERPTKLTNKELVKDALDGQLGGLIVLSGTAREEWTSLLRDRGLPLVGLSGNHSVQVQFDQQRLLDMIFAQLAQTDAQRLGYLGWDGFNEYTRELKSRRFQQEAKLRGYEVRDTWVCSDLPPNAPGSGWEAMREIWTGDDRPDALILQDDIMARDALRALSELRIQVPKDLHLIVLSSEPMTDEACASATQICYHLNDLAQAICTAFASIRFGTAGFRDYLSAKNESKHLFSKFYLHSKFIPKHEGKPIHSYT